MTGNTSEIHSVGKVNFKQIWQKSPKNGFHAGGDMFYLYKGEAWLCNNSNMIMFNVADPSITLDYHSLPPEEASSFTEIKSPKDPYVRKLQPEKLYRIITDTYTSTYLEKNSFEEIYSNVYDYLQETEQYERLCLIRDVRKFYLKFQEKRQIEIENQIKKFDKPETNTGT